MQRHRWRGGRPRFWMCPAVAVRIVPEAQLYINVSLRGDSGAAVAGTARGEGGDGPRGRGRGLWSRPKCNRVSRSLRAPRQPEITYFVLVSASKKQKKKPKKEKDEDSAVFSGSLFDLGEFYCAFAN